MVGLEDITNDLLLFRDEEGAMSGMGSLHVCLPQWKNATAYQPGREHCD